MYALSAHNEGSDVHHLILGVVEGLSRRGWDGVPLPVTSAPSDFFDHDGVYFIQIRPLNTVFYLVLPMSVDLFDPSLPEPRARHAHAHAEPAAAEKRLEAVLVVPSEREHGQALALHNSEDCA